jgi:hypothetical protein
MVSQSFGFLVSVHDQLHRARMKPIRELYLSSAIFAAKSVRRSYVLVDGAFVDSTAFARRFLHSEIMTPRDAWR